MGTENQDLPNWTTGCEDGWESGCQVYLPRQITQAWISSPTSNTSWGVKGDQPFLPLCVPFVEFNQAGSRAVSNPRVLRGPKRTGAGFVFNRGRRKRPGNEGKWSHQQSRISFPQLTPRQTSTSDCHHPLPPTGCLSTSLLSTQGSGYKVMSSSNHTALIKTSLAVWSSVIQLRLKSCRILHFFPVKAVRGRMRKWMSDHLFKSGRGVLSTQIKARS